MIRKLLIAKSYQIETLFLLRSKYILILRKRRVCFWRHQNVKVQCSLGRKCKKNCFLYWTKRNLKPTKGFKSTRMSSFLPCCPEHLFTGQKISIWKVKSIISWGNVLRKGITSRSFAQCSNQLIIWTREGTKFLENKLPMRNPLGSKDCSIVESIWVRKFSIYFLSKWEDAGKIWSLWKKMKENRSTLFEDYMNRKFILFQKKISNVLAHSLIKQSFHVIIAYQLCYWKKLIFSHQWVVFTRVNSSSLIE